MIRNRLVFIFAFLALSSCQMANNEKLDLQIANESIVSVVDGNVLTGKLISIQKDTVV